MEKSKRRAASGQSPPLVASGLSSLFRDSGVLNRPLRCLWIHIKFDKCLVVVNLHREPLEQFDGIVSTGLL